MEEPRGLSRIDRMAEEMERARLVFDELVDLLRTRIGDADAVKPGEIHSFKELMADHADEIADQWYWHALEELESQGHLHPASHKVFGGDARGTLSADGRWYLRNESTSS